MFNRVFTSHFCGSTRHDHNRAVPCRDIIDHSNHVRIIKSFLQSDCYTNSHSPDGFSMASFSDISAPALPPDTLLPPRGTRPLTTSAARLNHTPPAPRSGSARRSPPMSLRPAPPGRLTESFFEYRRPVVDNEPGDGPADRLSPPRPCYSASSSTGLSHRRVFCGENEYNPILDRVVAEGLAQGDHLRAERVETLPSGGRAAGDIRRTPGRGPSFS